MLLEGKHYNVFKCGNQQKRGENVWTDEEATTFHHKHHDSGMGAATNTQ